MIEHEKEEPLTKLEIFEFKKECLLKELEWRFESARYRLTHKWQLRLFFLVFSASFLSLSLSSETLRKIEIPLWQQVISTLLIFILFYIYDSNLGSLTLSVLRRVQNVSQLLMDLPRNSREELLAVKTYFEIREGLGRWERWKQRLTRIKELDFIVFYLLTGLLWFAGWWIRANNIKS